MINPRLYGVLTHLLGHGRIVDEGVRPVPDPSNPARTIQRGEHYYFNCPLCGDAKKRLLVSCTWLTETQGKRDTRPPRCFNESCQIRNSDFQRKVERLLGSPEALALERPYSSAVKPAAPTRVWRFPYGFQTLDHLGPDHPAIQFVHQKYPGIDPCYMAQAYGVGFTEEYDPDFRLARNRIIFPVFLGGKLTGWQGRTILKDEEVRWYLPTGFNKSVGLFNQDRIHEHQIPVICEGIPTAIAAGPTGVAIWGTSMSEEQCRAFGQRWRHAVIALDPETQLADARGKGPPKFYTRDLKARLDRHLSLPAQVVTYPPEIMELARRKLAGEKISVPDLADMGLQQVRAMITALPHPWCRLSTL